MKSPWHQIRKYRFSLRQLNTISQAILLLISNSVKPLSAPHMHHGYANGSTRVNRSRDETNSFQKVLP